jgi:hypothetical protein
MAMYGLEEFRAFRASALASDQISLVVKRRWVEDYERDVVAAGAERSRLIHRLPELDGIRIVDWGATDDSRPREIVEVLLVVLPAAISAAATLLGAWFMRDRQHPLTAADMSRARQAMLDRSPGESDSVAAVRITKPDGTTLELLRESAVSAPEVAELVVRFLRTT